MWNYRLVKQRDGYFSIREVYYNKAGEVWAMSAEPERLGVFEAPEEAKETVAMVLQDITSKPIFEEPEDDKWAKRDDE